MDKLNVGLFFGGRSGEHEVSIMSASSVSEFIDRRKYNVIPVAISKEGIWLDPETSTSALKEGFLDDGGQEVCLAGTRRGPVLAYLHCQQSPLPVDVAFPLLHGPYGEDGTIQGLFEMVNLPYVGAGVLASSIGMDKAFMKTIFAVRGLPQTSYLVVEKRDWEQKSEDIKQKVAEQQGFPCFVKPVALGSSVGISKVKNMESLVPAVEEALKYGPRILVEDYVPGRELECSVLGNEEPMVAGPGEIRPHREFYNYEAKYTEGGSDLIVFPDLPSQVKKRARELAIKAYKALDCRGMARVDFFLSEDNEVLVNELNTIPGFTMLSMYPKLWEGEGVDYRELIDRLIELALKK